MNDWYEEMERDEQERDAMEYELSLEYKRGRAEAIDDAIKKLAESEDTILTDKQYYTLMEMKEQKE